MTQPNVKSAAQLGLENDMKEAMRSGYKEKLALIRQVIDKIQKVAKEKKVEFATDDMATEAILAFRNVLKEEQFENEKIGRVERAAQLEAQVEFVNTYLPEPLTDAEVDEIIQQAMDRLGDKAIMGLVMKEVQPLVKGRADNKTVSDKVKAALVK